MSDMRKCSECGSWNWEPTGDPCHDCAMEGAAKSSKMSYEEKMKDSQERG